MKHPTAYHQLGTFIVYFQKLERMINDIVILLAETDEETARIMIAELEFHQRLSTCDVLFSRFNELKKGGKSENTTKFHSLIGKVRKLSERRNELVHSSFTHWTDHKSRVGLIRENARLRASKGILERIDEELLPEAFDSDLADIRSTWMELEEFRLLVIDLLHPETDA